MAVWLFLLQSFIRVGLLTRLGCVQGLRWSSFLILMSLSGSLILVLLLFLLWLATVLPCWTKRGSWRFRNGGQKGCCAQEFHRALLGSVQFSSVTQSCPTLCDPMNRSTPGLPVHHQLPEFTQTHLHWVGDAIQPSHPLSSSSPPAPNPSQHQGLFQWVNSSHEVAKILEFQLQHQSFQWTPGIDLL